MSAANREYLEARQRELARDPECIQWLKDLDKQKLFTGNQPTNGLEITIPTNRQRKVK